MCSSNIIHKLACNNGLSSLVVRPDIGKQFSWLVLCREFSSAALFYLILFSFLVSKENLTHLFIVCSRIWFQPHPVQILTSYKFFWQVHDSLHVQMFSLIYIYIYISKYAYTYVIETEDIRNLWRFGAGLKGRVCLYCTQKMFPVKHWIISFGLFSWICFIQRPHWNNFLLLRYPWSNKINFLP